MIDRRAKLQELMPEGWTVYRPFKGDADASCVFQNVGEDLQAYADIPQQLFDDGEDHQIEHLIRQALSGAVIML